jgi:putative transposase
VFTLGRYCLLSLLKENKQAVSRLSFQKATALTTALALRQAIWHKEDPRWHASGIPTTFYTDHGSDFTSKHLEQVATDLPMELIFSQVGIPRGRGKVERFFRSVDQLLLQNTPGYAPKGSMGVKATLTLPVFEQRFRTWLLEDYHHRVDTSPYDAGPSPLSMKLACSKASPPERD